MKKLSSITAVMKALFKKNINTSYEAACRAVGGRSKVFDKRHFSWYKAAFKRGALKGVR